MTTSASAWSNVFVLDKFRNSKNNLVEAPNLRSDSGVAPWEKAAVQRLEELMRLRQGWDGHSAPPVGFYTAVFAFSMLKSICATDTPIPNILPGYHGDLQVEWRSQAIEIQLHVLAPNRVQAYISAPSMLDEDIEQNLQADFKSITEWVAALISHDGDNAKATA